MTKIIELMEQEVGGSWYYIEGENEIKKRIKELGKHVKHTKIGMFHFFVTPEGWAIRKGSEAVICGY